MKKIVSVLLLWILGFTLTQAETQQGQRRMADSETSPEVSRIVAKADNRSAAAALTARSVAAPGSSLITSPASPSLKHGITSRLSAHQPRKVSSTLDVYGTVIFADSWTSSDAPYGVYKIPVANGAVSDKLFGVNKNPIFSFFDGEQSVYTLYELAYGTWVMGYDLYVYDTESKKNVNIIEFDDLPIKATDVAYDPTSGKVYGLFSGEYYGSDYRYWGYLDIKTKKVISIVNYDFSLRGVAIDKFGQAYGIDLEGALYKIEKETGAYTKIGGSGCPGLKYMSSAAYNDKDNNIMLTYSNDNGGGMVSIDPATGNATEVSVFADGDEVIGLYIPFQAPDKAPATPSFSVACAEGSMQADFTVGMPETLFDGTSAAGQGMGYRIYANGSEILSGNSVAGATVKVSKTLTASGITNFVAVATNAEGESNQAKASCYVGKGTPAATGKALLSYENGSLILTWEAVTESSDGGYINPADVRYDVVDSENNVVASDLAVTTWSKPQAIPSTMTGYSFGVIAKYDGKTSKAIMSNSIFLGHYTAPATVSFLSAGTFEQHKVIDANADGSTWVADTSKGATYKYNKNNDGDDWLISPAFYLEAGKAYDFQALAHAYGDKYPEKIEICMGTAPAAEAMTTTLVETTTLGGASQALTANVAPTVSGEYYFGFHAVSDAYQWSLYLTQYSISEPFGATAPDCVTDLTLTPDITGDLNVAISFKAPAKTVVGANYTGGMKVNILRDGEAVATIDATAGATATYTDKVTEAGEHTYTVITANLAGDTGRSASANVFVGPNVPNAPVDVKAVENAQNLGELTLTWKDPETDIAGNPLLPSNLKYNVYFYDTAKEGFTLLNAEPISERTYTFRAQSADAPQAFAQVLIETINRGVVAQEYAGPGMVAVGPGYTLPVAMTCLEDAKKYNLGMDDWDGCEFGMKTDGEMSSVTSQDGDGQFFYGERVGSSATLGMGKGVGDFIFGKVDLKGAKNPVFSLYTWKITETDKTRLEIIVLCEGERKTVTDIEYADDTHNLWTKKVVDLAEYKDKAIQLIIRYYSDGLVYCFFDNMKFMDMPDYDINAVSVTAPKTVTGGEPFEVTAKVENVGRLAVADFDVELLANGKVVATKKVESLAAGETADVIFEQVITMAQDKVVEYTAHVVSSADLDDSNDVTPKAAKVTREESTLPAVTNFTGKKTAEGNLLTWDAVTPEDLPYDPTVESFENADPFTKAYPEWTFVDRDGKPCGGTGNIAIPNHEYGVDPESFIVIDGTYSGFANSSYAKEYTAADGKQYLGSLWTKGDADGTIATSDDWAISPLLKGCAQTVTFFAKNASINYSEFLQIWYATSDTTDPDEFTMVKDFNNNGYNYRIIRTDGWGEFSVDLPEGAVRMAFRCVSNDGMMLMLDNVSYLAADATVGLEHKGYNIYCDGAKLNESPLTANTFTHTDTTADHTYHVTAVYNRGESEASEPVFIAVSGVDEIFANGLDIEVEGKQIIITGATDNNVRVIAADGKTVFTAQGDCRTTVVPGFYLVAVGETVVKVVVK
ncbi:MAG: choice-of-anchor J domain-containing protein [Muribaculaceae bacterium]|nr:choice-of-anchor J domain-containing protein [Muribaculaceae bacterium]